jgi:hypothetical protein
MLRKVLVNSTASLFFANAFAQQEKNSYVEEMQQKFNQASNEATAQFDKKYPAPHVAQSTTEKLPTVEHQQTPPLPPPPPKSITPPPVAAQPAKKTPDVAVSSDKTDASVGNIYASGGSSQNSNTSINPYR